MRSSQNFVGAIPSLRQNITAIVWLRILRKNRELKCQVSLALTVFMLNLLANWEKTLSLSSAFLPIAISATPNPAPSRWRS